MGTPLGASGKVRILQNGEKIVKENPALAACGEGLAAIGYGRCHAVLPDRAATAPLPRSGG
jgi:hypothetical protein